MWTFVNTGCPGVVRGSMTCTISGWKALTMDRFEFLDWPDFLESLLSKMLKCVHSSGDSDLLRPQVTYLDLFFFESENLNFIFIICDAFKPGSLKSKILFWGNRMWRLNLYRWNRRWRLSIIKIAWAKSIRIGKLICVNRMFIWPSMTSNDL